MVIGITGNSGTGKTEISKLLAKKIEAEIINADEVAKEMSKKGQEYYTEVIKIFGEDFVEENGLNRKRIAEIIYKNSEQREALNKLTFTYVVDEIEKRVKNAKSKNIIIDAPLLFESNLDKICKITIAVLANEETKLKRISTRDKIDETIAQARINIQKNDEFYIEKADYIIKNNGQIDEINLEEICTKIGKN